MDDDLYAFCCEIEKDVVAAFNKVGLAAFEKKIRARFEVAAQDPSNWDFRNASGILRAIYCAQRDVQAYATLAELTDESFPRPACWLGFSRRKSPALASMKSWSRC